MKNYVGSIELVQPPVEITEESLANYIASLVDVVYAKEVKNPMKRFKALQTEAYANTASHVMSFIPVIFGSEHIKSICNLSDIQNGLTIQNFGFFQNNQYFTNMREMLNLEWTVKELLPFVDFTHYKVFKCKAPRFSYNHCRTHSQMTMVSFSARYSDNKNGYFKPFEINCTQAEWDHIVENTSPIDLLLYMKNNGITRKEVYTRGKDSLQMVDFSIGGYTNSPYAWKWFINQRSDNHTQEETKNFVKMFKKLL